MTSNPRASPEQWKLWQMRPLNCHLHWCGTVLEHLQVILEILWKLRTPGGKVYSRLSVIGYLAVDEELQ